MPTYRSLLTERLKAALAKAAISVPDNIAIEVMPASDTRFGDYQSNVAMTVAKAAKMNPRQLATTSRRCGRGAGVVVAGGVGNITRV